MQSPSDLQESLPYWTITLDEFATVLVQATPRLVNFPYPVYPLVFSCSSNGIWPTSSLGYMPPATRRYIDGKSNILDALAQVMTSRHNSSNGGRFTVTLDGAFVTRDNAPLARFQLTA